MVWPSNLLKCAEREPAQYERIDTTVCELFSSRLKSFTAFIIVINKFLDST